MYARYWVFCNNSSQSKSLKQGKGRPSQLPPSPDVNGSNPLTRCHRNPYFADGVDCSQSTDSAAPIRSIGRYRHRFASLEYFQRYLALATSLTLRLLALSKCPSYSLIPGRRKQVHPFNQGRHESDSHTCRYPLCPAPSLPVSRQ
jgi:hypothetical protein